MKAIFFPGQTPVPPRSGTWILDLSHDPIWAIWSAEVRKFHQHHDRIAHRCLSQDLTDDKSTLVQVMAWCHQATSHYLNQCWSRSMPWHGTSKPQWVNCTKLCLQTYNSHKTPHTCEGKLWGVYCKYFKDSLPVPSRACKLSNCSMYALSDSSPSPEGEPSAGPPNPFSAPFMKICLQQNQPCNEYLSSNSGRAQLGPISMG